MPVLTKGIPPRVSQQRRSGEGLRRELLNEKLGFAVAVGSALVSRAGQLRWGPERVKGSEMQVFL